MANTEAGRRPTSNGRVFLVLELLHDPTERSGSVCLVQSIPGREGTLTKRWRSPFGIITTSQLDDLVTSAAQTIEQAVVTFTGAQGTLGH